LPNIKNPHRGRGRGGTSDGQGKKSLGGVQGGRCVRKRRVENVVRQFFVNQIGKESRGCPGHLKKGFRVEWVADREKSHELETKKIIKWGGERKHSRKTEGGKRGCGGRVTGLMPERTRKCLGEFAYGREKVKSREKRKSTKAGEKSLGRGEGSSGGHSGGGGKIPNNLLRKAFQQKKRALFTHKQMYGSRPKRKKTVGGI